MDNRKRHHRGRVLRIRKAFENQSGIELINGIAGEQFIARIPRPQMLFDDGITAKGKPLAHHLMNEDLKNAYLWVMEQAKYKTPVTTAFLREANARIMKSRLVAKVTVVRCGIVYQ